MTAYRLIGGAVCRQDVPGGDWVELTKDEANTLLATVPRPVHPSALEAGAELILNTWSGDDRITDLERERAVRTVKELADILCGATVYEFTPQPDFAMTMMSGDAVDAWPRPIRAVDVVIDKNTFRTVPTALSTPPSQAIDAGDGEPVAWRYSSAFVTGPDMVKVWLRTSDRALAEREAASGNAVQPLYTHPAGTVSVSDEMVEAALEAYYGSGHPISSLDAHNRDDMRAALTAALRGGARK